MEAAGIAWTLDEGKVYSQDPGWREAVFPEPRMREGLFCETLDGGRGILGALDGGRGIWWDPGCRERVFPGP